MGAEKAEKKSNVRRNKILEILRRENKPVPGTTLSSELGVSRQIIVQDISIIRDEGNDIISTNRGYLLQETPVFKRVFKVIHTEDEFEDEAQIVFSYGGRFHDIFVYHKVYGVIRADMDVKNRSDMEDLLENIRTGKSSMLMNITSGFHYHTISAESEKALDRIQEQFAKRGFLAKLQDYEPVDFWKKNDTNQ